MEAWERREERKYLQWRYMDRRIELDPPHHNRDRDRDPDNPDCMVTRKYRR